MIAHPIRLAHALTDRSQIHQQVALHLSLILLTQRPRLGIDGLDEGHQRIVRDLSTTVSSSMTFGLCMHSSCPSVNSRPSRSSGTDRSKPSGEVGGPVLEDADGVPLYARCSRRARVSLLNQFGRFQQLVWVWRWSYVVAGRRLGHSATPLP
jgi:hypothetical protein